MTETVTVACKLPNGLVLEVADLEWLPIQHEMSVRKSNVRQWVIKGSAPQRRLESNGNLVGETAEVVGGFGLTHGVPLDFWERWLDENRDFAPVRAGLIFANPRQGRAAGQAKEQTGIKSGLEAIDTSGGDPRMGRGVVKADKPQ